MMGSRQREHAAAVLLRNAVSAGHIGAAYSLLQAGANPNIDTQGNHYPLAIATMRGSLDLVRLLLQHGADVALRGPTGYPPLHTACILGHLAILDELLNFGADPSEKYDKDRTPLHWLAREGSIVILKKLICAGAQLNARDSDGHAAIHHAAALGNLSALQALVEAGSSHAWRSNSLQTPLVIACSFGQIRSVMYLCDECGADPGVVNVLTNTPLSIAALRGHLAVVERLVRFDVRQLGPNAYTDALCGVAKSGNTSVLKVLLNADGRAHVNGIQRTTKLTPLICSIGNLHPIATSMLLDAGGDETAVNPAGKPLFDVVDTFRQVSQQLERQQRVKRMLAQAPAYRARSWRWPDAPPAFALTLTAAPTVKVAKQGSREAGAAPTKGPVEPGRMTPEGLDDAYDVARAVMTTDATMQNIGVRVLWRLPVTSGRSAMDGYPMVIAGLIRYARKT